MNWYKLSAWYDKEPVEADPAEVGYNPEWGDHHGPVKYKPDTWNYGPKGYPYQSVPMPMPKKIYHVTPFPNEIMREGFKTFEDMSKQTFGGHGTYVSFTNLADAKVYHKGLYTMWELANGYLDESDLLSLAKQWGVKQEKAQQLLQQKKQEAAINRYTPEQMIAEFLKAMSFVSGDGRFPNSPRFPLFVGTSRTLLERLKGMDGRDIAILEAEVPEPMEWHNGVNVFKPEEMKGKYTYNGSENEWRVWDPSRLPRETIRRVL